MACALRVTQLVTATNTSTPWSSVGSCSNVEAVVGSSEWKSSMVSSSEPDTTDSRLPPIWRGRSENRGRRTKPTHRWRLHDERVRPAGLSLQPALQLLHGAAPFALDPRPGTLPFRLLIYRAADPAGRGVPRRHLYRHPQRPRQDLRFARAILGGRCRDVP